MEEAYEIIGYLPISYKTETDQEYINFLFETFEVNYEQGKYQFAFLALHMLYMAFVYFKIWQIKTTRKEDFDKALIAFRNDEEKELLEATSPFVFHKINESMIFRFLKLLGCDKSEIGNYIKMVRDRNSIAHSCGNIFYNSQESMNQKITDFLKLIEEIQNHSEPIIKECFKDFLLNNYDPDKREYLDDEDQIREVLVHNNYFSEKDIEACYLLDIKKLSKHKNYSKIKCLYDSFCDMYPFITSTGGAV